MPINPAIALGVRPIEIQQRDPLQDYAQISSIQNAQLQNQLARQQMEQEQGVLNYLREPGKLATPEGRAGLRQFGKTGLAYEKLISEQETNALKRQELEGKLRDQRMTALGTGLTSVLADPSDANLAAAFDRLDATGVDTKPFRQQFAGMPDLAARKAAITQYVTSNPEGRQALAFVQPKPEKFDLNGKIVVVDMNPNSPTYQQQVKEYAKGMSPYESARIGQENQRLAQEATGVVYQEDANGNIVALPSKLKKGEVPTARVAVAPGGGFQPLAAKPSEAVGKEQMSLNQQKAIVQGAIDAAKATPDAFGWTTGNMPESVRARMASSAENKARAFVFNVVSGVIKERAGTAQSAGEAATLRRFLPDETDNAQIIQDKMEGFQKYLAAKEAGTTKKRAAPEKPTPVRINGDDDYNKLPSGALFIGPDGQQRRKP